ncbi:hypothetical protein [Citrobacter phage Ci1]|nr:hypothetical protein [Citrobacter phage Ci1]
MGPVKNHYSNLILKLNNNRIEDVHHVMHSAEGNCSNLL